MVELRTCTHLHSQLHYIQAIKDGSIKIVMNKDARGKSKLKFRQLVDVYNRENIRGDDKSIPRVVRDLDNVSDMTKGSCLFGAEVNIKTVLDDFSMTLEKIRRQCKEKKRKLRNRRDTEIASQVKVKQEYSTLPTEDEGCDLEEPLSSWNTKFSKRRKKKQELKTKCGSTSSPPAKQVCLPVFCDVKPEAWDDSYSVSEALDFISTDPLLDCSKESKSTTNTELVEEIMHDLSKGTRLALYCSPEPTSLGMVAIEEPITTKPVEKTFEDASEEFNGALKARFCLADNIALENQENVLDGGVSKKETELEVSKNPESEIIGCVNNPISYNTNLVCEEVKEESNDSKPNLYMPITGLEIVKIEAPEIIATDSSGLPTMDSGVENTEILWETEDIAKDDELPEATDIIQLAKCCNSLANLHLVPDDGTIPLEEAQLPERLHQQPAPSGHVDEPEDHITPQLYKAPDEVTTGAETDSIHQQKLHNQPEKLLSGRKVCPLNNFL